MNAKGLKVSSYWFYVLKCVIIVKGWCSYVETSIRYAQLIYVCLCPCIKLFDMYGQVVCIPESQFRMKC